MPVSAAGLTLEAVDYVGPGNEENSGLGAAAESNAVAGYHLAYYHPLASSDHELNHQPQYQAVMLQ